MTPPGEHTGGVGWGPASTAGHLVGRGDEVRRLRRLLDEAASGIPRAMVIHGEAGVGKTRLVREVLAQVDWLELWGTCVHFGASTLPFAPLVGALRPWLADEDGYVETGRLMPVVDGVLEKLAADRPTVLVVDDLHWADVSSLDALAYVVAGFRGQRLAVVATCREEHRPDGHPLHAWLADLRRMSGFEEMHLDRLGLVEIELLVNQVVGRPVDFQLVAEVYERSGGNPYLTELLVRDLPADARRLPATGPAVLTQALTARWHTLSDKARLAVQILSVGGRPQRRELFLRVASAHGLTEQDVDAAVAEATEKGVTSLSHERVWFRHPLLADVLYGAVSDPAAERFHATYAAMLEALVEVPESRRADDLAVHHLRAGHVDEAYVWSVRAADAAAVAESASEAVHLERACQLWPQVSEELRGSVADRVAMLRRTALVDRRVGRLDEAVRLIEEARELVSTRRDPLLSSTLLSTWCTFVWERDAPVQAVRPELFEALRLVEDQPDSAERVRALTGLAEAHSWDGLHEAAGEYATEALAAARRSGAAEALVEALTCRAHVQLGDLETRLAELVEGYDLARSIGALEEMTSAAIWQVNLLEGLGRPWEAARLASDAFEEGLQIGSQAWSYFLAGQAAALLLDLGDWEEARRLFRRALAARPHGIPGAIVRLAAAEHAVLVGDLAESRSHLERALELVPEHFAGLHFTMSKVHVHLLIAEGEPVRAMEWMLARRSFPTRDDLDSDVNYLAWTVWAMAEVAESARDHGDEATVDAVCDRLDQLLEESGRSRGTSRAPETPETVRVARFLRAQEARCRRSPDEAVRWGEAVEAARAAEHPWHEAYALWRQVQAELHSHGHRGRQAELLRAAHRIAVRLGARPLRSQIEYLATSARLTLADVGSPVPADRPGPGKGVLEALTDREREVLDHLVAGRSNAEVARHLGISDKTVSVHVSNILRKTGAASRVEAAELARRQL